ncbi:MAG: electron transport complex subunit RsxE [Gemmatimonadaceae bacterium]|nr:electron transport complex subunit RsxE [Gemmatimonadaceae bacterium]
MTATAHAPGESTTAPAVTALERPLMTDFMRGVLKENPVVVQMLGMCPTMAVTNNVANAFAMGMATLFVLVGSEFFVSLLKKWFPNEVRIASYILIIATFVTLAELLLQALVPDIHKALGPFIALIVANCLLLGRQEAFAAKEPVGRSVLDALGMGLGFTISLTTLGSIREILGNGSWLSFRVLPASYEPWTFMVLPPGGFFTLGLLLLGITVVKDWRDKRAVAVRA